MILAWSPLDSVYWGEPMFYEYPEEPPRKPIVRNARGAVVTQLGTKCLTIGVMFGPGFALWIAMCNHFDWLGYGLYLINVCLILLVQGAISLCACLLLATHITKGRTGRQLIYAWSGFLLSISAFLPLCIGMDMLGSIG